MQSKAFQSHSSFGFRAGILAAALVVATMFASTLGLATAGAKTAGVTNGPVQSTLYLTHDGKIVGVVPAPKGANDLHYVWHGKEGCRNGILFPLVTVYFTENGRIIGKALAPCKSNDFEFKWDANTGLITGATWTVNGLPMNPPITVPTGSNDVHVFLTGATRLVKAWWTLNGKPLQF